MRAIVGVLLVMLLTSLFAFNVAKADFELHIDKRWAVLVCGWLEFQIDTDIAYDLLVDEYNFDGVLYLSPVKSSDKVNLVANWDNVHYAFSTWLSEHADSDDLVFIFFSSHGGGCNTTGHMCWGREDEDGDEPLKDYWNGTAFVGVDECVCLQRHQAHMEPWEYEEEDFEKYWDDELRQDLLNISYARLVCTFVTCKTENSTSEPSCFGGGFCSDLSAQNRIIIASCSEKEYCYCDPTGSSYTDEWGVVWYQFLGCFSKPFLNCLYLFSQEFMEADMNEDSIVSMKEAFDYGLTNDPKYQNGEEHPVLEDTQNSLLNDGALSWLTCLDETQPSRIPPDINDDGYVNAKDAVLLGVSFGSKEGEQLYNPDADVNKDGFINAKDAIILGKNFGEGLENSESQSMKKLANLPKSEYSTLLKVQPNENVFYTTSTNVGDAFNVSIVVENVSCLYGWEVALEWNNGMINCTDETINYAFWTYYLGPWVSNPINNSVGRYHQSLTARDPAQSFNGTTWLVNLTFQIIQSPLEGGTLSTELMIKANPGTDYCLLNTSSSEIPHGFINGHYSYISPRYMRGDLHSVNGLEAYKLDTTQSNIYKVSTVTAYQHNTVYWGIRVWKRSTEGVETEITSGTPVAQVNRSVDGQGIQTATWNCPNINFSSTDSIVIRVYCNNGGSWILQATFTTDQLGAESLDAGTWTVYYWTKRMYAFLSGRQTTIGYFRWRTTTYNSRIENFTVTLD